MRHTKPKKFEEDPFFTIPSIFYNNNLDHYQPAGLLSSRSRYENLGSVQVRSGLHQSFLRVAMIKGAKKKKKRIIT